MGPWSFLKVTICFVLVSSCSAIRSQPERDAVIYDSDLGWWNSMEEKIVNVLEWSLDRLFQGTNVLDAQWSSRSVLPELSNVRLEHVSSNGKDYLPIVQMHGMGDAAENPGMKQIRDLMSDHLGGSYVTNIALGDTATEDASNSFFMNMDKQVDAFAVRVKEDPKLRDGFNAIGYSQGNLVIRGYVERFNDPPVHNFVSVHGPLLGVAGFPQCSVSSAICRLINKSLGIFAYSGYIQQSLAQANYFRDPMRIDQFLKGDLFLADINNDREGEEKPGYSHNFAQLNKLVLVKAKEDTEVVPSESEWFGYYKDGSVEEVLTMEDTYWYSEDRFGLKTLTEAGKIVKLETPGNHLQVSQEFLLQLVDDYFQDEVIKPRAIQAMDQLYIA